LAGIVGWLMSASAHKAPEQEHQYHCPARDHGVGYLPFDYRKSRGLNFGQFSSGFSDGRFSGRSG
jgi:hypothetical protein